MHLQFHVKTNINNYAFSTNTDANTNSNPSAHSLYACLQSINIKIATNSGLQMY